MEITAKPYSRKHLGRISELDRYIMRQNGYLSIRDFAIICGVESGTVNGWVNSGRVPHVEHRGFDYIPEDFARQFAASYEPRYGKKREIE